MRHAIDHHAKELIGLGPPARGSYVVALLPIRVVPEVFDRQASPDEVAAGNLDGQGDYRHHAKDGVRVSLRPLPSVHTAHGHAEDGMQAFDAKRFSDKLVLDIS